MRRGDRACSCGAGTHWVSTWSAAPGDAGGYYTPDDGGLLLEFVTHWFDNSFNVKLPPVEETDRVILTPHWGGSKVRLHLSNRFGTTPVTFGAVTLGKQAQAASLAPGSVVPVTFGGRRSLTAAPGADIVSDPVAITYAAFERLATSVYVQGAPGIATEHFTGRQTSYMTGWFAGNRTADTSGGSYTRRTTTRPYVSGLDVAASRNVGGVVAFGDSITDGYQGELLGFPETIEGLDQDARWPDGLQRRINAAGLPFAVANAGLSGNRILQEGTYGDGVVAYGPSALKRLDADVLASAGVGTAIVLEGANDLGLQPVSTAPQIQAGITQIVARLRAAGLRVLVGTLTPMTAGGGGSPIGFSKHGTPAANEARLAVNRWIRTSGIGDGFVDFDAAVRDPADPSRLKPQFNGGDNLHLSSAGYAAMAAAVPLDQLSAHASACN